jgi:hypothetical protein
LIVIHAAKASDLVSFFMMKTVPKKVSSCRICLLAWLMTAGDLLLKKNNDS